MIALIAGLGFGDEGKGSFCDALCQKLTLTKQPVVVTRYNGGAQCAHNVVLPDGTHHTFKQFGSGTLHGAKTHLSRHMLVNPLALDREAEVLHFDKGVNNPWELLTIEREALVTNVYQIAANRIREMCRGASPHGSCGMGIGETVGDALEHPKDTLRVKDLYSRSLVEEKLDLSRQRKLASLPEGYEEHVPEDDLYLRVLKGEGFQGYVNAYTDFGRNQSSCFVGADYLSELQMQDVHLIFEGGQGVLLDQDYGFFPHVTRTKTTFDNALDLLEEDVEYTTFGVLRAYMTRHGHGPMPTEGLGEELESDVHNAKNQFQGAWRTGPLDLVLLRYAVDVLGGVDRLILTHLDRISEHPQCCRRYENDETLQHNPKVDLVRQAQLTERLSQMTPKISTLETKFDLIFLAQLVLEAPVQWCSFGPTHQHKMAPELYFREW